MTVAANRIGDNVVVFRVNVDSAGTAEAIDEDGDYGRAHELWLQSPAANTGITYIGGSTAAQATIGFDLPATGAIVGPIKSRNGIPLSSIFVDAGTTNDDVTIMAILQD